MPRIKQSVRKSPVGHGKGKTLIVSGAKRPAPVSSTAAARKPHRFRPDTLVARKPHRFRPGTRALIEIRQAQKSCLPLLPRSSFNALVREGLKLIQQDPDGAEFKARTAELRFSAESLDAIRDATEAHQLYLLTRTCAAALHAHRVTARDEDLNFTEGMVGLKELLVRGEKPRYERAKEAAEKKAAEVQARVDKKRAKELEESEARKAVDRIHADIEARKAKRKSEAKASLKDKKKEEEEDDDATSSEASDSENEDQGDDMDTSITAKETAAQKRRREDREAKQLSLDARKRIDAQAASASAASASASSAPSSSAAAAPAANSSKDKEDATAEEMVLD